MIDFVDESIDANLISIASFSANKADARSIASKIIKTYDKLWRSYIGKSYDYNEAKFSKFIKEIAKVKERVNVWHNIVSELMNLLTNILEDYNINVLVVKKNITFEEIGLLLSRKIFRMLMELAKGSRKIIKRYMREIGKARFAKPSNKVILLSAFLLAVCKNNILVDKNLLYTKAVDIRSLRAVLKIISGLEVNETESLLEPGIQVADFLAGFIRNFYKSIKGVNCIRIHSLKIWLLF